MTKPHTAILASLPLLLASAVRAAPAESETRYFALVIGSNAPLDPHRRPLRFADDDAARIAELLGELGADVELVTTLDQDSQATFGALVERARPPTHENVFAAQEALAERIRAAHAAGAQTELMIFYSGHGDVGPDGNEFLNLAGGKLTRDDLFGALLGRSPADFNHVLIDACRSEELVLSRGEDWAPDRAGPEYSRAVKRYLESRQLESYSHTGVVLATSADQQTHEWERYRGGVFTHQLLSGLRGAADLNGDGRIEYSELGAFVAAANSGVSDPRARLRAVVLPPAADERHPLVRYPNVAGGRLVYFPRQDAGRYTLEDARGVRLADLRRGGESPGYVRLPAGDVFVYRERVDAADHVVVEEARIPAGTEGLVRADALAFAGGRQQARGALDVALRGGLFKVGYGPGYYAGYTDRVGALAVEDPEWEVKVWRVAGGDRAEVAHVRITDEEDDEAGWLESQWGALSLETESSLYLPVDQIDGDAGLISSTDVSPWLGPVRGFGLRWHSFSLDDGEDYPDSEVFFRTGYTRGQTRLTPPGGLGAYRTGDPTALTTLSVPVFVGFNAYLFDEFPLRPFGGAGVGVDVLRLRYDRAGERARTDLSARVGIEIHAGLELRVTNHVALQGEFRQLWSDTRELRGLPNYAHDGLTATVGLAVGVPFRSGRRHRTARRREPVHVNIYERTAPPPAEETPPPKDTPPPAPPASPKPQAPPETPEA